MSVTRGGPNKSKRFQWQYDPSAERVIITGERGKTHTYALREIHAILRALHARLGVSFFPLANNVQKLGDGTEQPGLGTAILNQMPGDTYHAQGASHLGVVLEECGYLEWNGKHRGIAWRLLNNDSSLVTLVARLQGASRTGEMSQQVDVKVVVQCAGSKVGKWWTWQGRPVKFVAHPELCEPSSEWLYARPDDTIPGYPYTWRQVLVAYNRTGKNPGGLCRAGDLYKRRAYGQLVDACGWEHTYILSAGWGLVRADYLLPWYDITFAGRADPCQRRRKGDPYDDFNQLAEADVDPEESICFFGGKDYLPLYYQLTRELPGRKLIYHTSKRLKKEEGYEYVEYVTARRTNWHYSCVEDFVAGRLAR